MSAPYERLDTARPLLERLDDAVHVLDARGRLQFANDAARRLYGLEAAGEGEEVLTRLVAEMDRASAGEALVALAAGRSWSGQIPVRKADGGVVVVQSTTSPLVDHDGEVVAALVVARDVTASAQAVAALRDRERQMAEAELLAGLGSWTWEPQTDRVTWSQGLYDIYGLDGSERPTVDGFLSCIHPDDRAMVEQRFADAIASDEIFDTRYRIVRPDGTVRWTVNRGRVVQLDRDGNPTRIAGATLDITDRRVAREGIETLRSIAAATDDAMFTTSLDGTITSWNQGAERLYGFGADDAVGRSVLDTIVPSNQADEVRAMLTSVREGRRVTFPITYRRRRDDQAVPVSLVASPVRDADGYVAGAVLIDRDVTSQLLLLQQAGQATKLDAVGQLAAAIAHDFANVLTAVDGFASVVDAKAGAGEDVREDVKGIQSAVASGIRLIDRLLGFAGRGAVPAVVFEVGDVVDDILPVLERLAGDNVRVEVAGAPGVRVRGDADLLEQSLVNLVINARDAMPDGGTVTLGYRLVALVEQPTTTVVPLDPGRYAAVSVSDDGMGMDEAVLRQCVDPFFTTKPGSGGRGLGLASVVSAVRANGGSVEVESVPGRGTVVTLYLPAAVDVLP